MSNIFNRRPYTGEIVRDINSLIIPPGLAPEILRLLPDMVLRVVELSGEKVKEFMLTTYGEQDEMMVYPTLSAGTSITANVRDAGTF